MVNGHRGVKFKSDNKSNSTPLNVNLKFFSALLILNKQKNFHKYQHVNLNTVTRGKMDYFSQYFKTSKIVFEEPVELRYFY